MAVLPAVPWCLVVYLQDFSAAGVTQKMHVIFRFFFLPKVIDFNFN